MAIKSQELNNADSCLNRASAREHIFVLLARDAAAPVAIRAWCAERVRIGKNRWDDAQIVSALSDAAVMERNK